MKDIMSIRLIIDSDNDQRILVGFADGTGAEHEYSNLAQSMRHRDKFTDIQRNQTERKKISEAEQQDEVVQRNQTERKKISEAEQQDEVVRKNLLDTLDEFDDLYDTQDIYSKKLRKALIKVLAHYSAYGDTTNHPEVNKYLDKTLKF